MSRITNLDSLYSNVKIRYIQTLEYVISHICMRHVTCKEVRIRSIQTFEYVHLVWMRHVTYHQGMSHAIGSHDVFTYIVCIQIYKIKWFSHVTNSHILHIQLYITYTWIRMNSYVLHIYKSKESLDVTWLDYMCHAFVGVCVIECVVCTYAHVCNCIRVTSRIHEPHHVPRISWSVSQFAHGTHIWLMKTWRETLHVTRTSWDVLQYAAIRHPHFLCWRPIRRCTCCDFLDLYVYSIYVYVYIYIWTYVHIYICI